MTAPVCPVSSSQLPYYHSLFRGNDGAPNAPTTLSIPMAYDLPSLIRTVNVMRDVLRQLTTSKVTNNTYLPRPPNFKSEGNKYYSQYPNWAETQIESVEGIVVHKKKKNGETIPDPSSRAYVQRQNRVHFENQTQEDKEFVWSYSKPIK